MFLQQCSCPIHQHLYSNYLKFHQFCKEALLNNYLFSSKGLTEKPVSWSGYYSYKRTSGPTNRKKVPHRSLLEKWLQNGSDVNSLFYYTFPSSKYLPGIWPRMNKGRTIYKVFWVFLLRKIQVSQISAMENKHWMFFVSWIAHNCSTLISVHIYDWQEWVPCPGIQDNSGR